MKVCIDPGHGGIDPGAVNGELREKDVALAVAQHLEVELAARAHHVVMTRNSDVFIDLYRRAAIANEAGCALFVSIHCNAAPNPEAHGMEVFHFARSTRGEALAQRILRALARRFPDHRNRGVKPATFAVLRKTRMPAALVELEFLSHPAGATFLTDAANQRHLARAIAEGLSGEATAAA
jgi:N-acetylmuramoyl-L-alanine amidase